MMNYKSGLIARWTPIVMLALVASSAILYQAPPAGAAACRAFPETGKQVCGTFLAYWQNHGGLPLQGLPLTNEMQEKSDTDGKTYTVQYFERAVFELHPENREPYNVLLSLLGVMSLRANYPNGAPPPPTRCLACPDQQVFPATGFTVSGNFLHYWRAYGGLAQFGYPISARFSEKSALDGKVYETQYFERAVFESHPENRPPYDVLLSQLGTFRYKARYGRTLTLGAWGGDHASLTVTADGATYELDCAHGRLDGPIAVGADGHFQANGTFVTEMGVQPAQEDTNSQPARIEGSTDGHNLTLTITLLNNNSVVNTFKLAYGATPRLFKCQ